MRVRSALLALDAGGCSDAERVGYWRAKLDALAAVDDVEDFMMARAAALGSGAEETLSGFDGGGPVSDDELGDGGGDVAGVEGLPELLPGGVGGLSGGGLRGRDHVVGGLRDVVEVVGLGVLDAGPEVIDDAPQVDSQLLGEGVVAVEGLGDPGDEVDELGVGGTVGAGGQKAWRKR